MSDARLEPEVLVTVSLRFPAGDPAAFGDHIAPLVAAALRLGGRSTTVSVQGYDPEEGEDG